MYSTEALVRVAPPYSIWAIIVKNIKQLADRSGGMRTAGRAPYVTPRLKVFGPVAALTQAGTGSMSEVMGNNVSSSRNQQRP